MRLMVNGFYFSPDMRQVLLVHKQQGWQQGKFNGLGGKIEPTDTNSPAAMRREFREEAGVDVPEDRWKFILNLQGADWSVDFYYSVAESQAEMDALTGKDDKGQSLYLFDPLNLPSAVLFKCRWLIPLALDPDIIKPLGAFGDLTRSC